MKKQDRGLALKMGQKSEEVSAILKALAHPQRLLILCHLAQGEKTVGELEQLCSVSQSVTSQFLAKMKTQGLVSSEKRGLHVIYSIEDERVAKLMSSLYDIFCK